MGRAGDDFAKLTKQAIEQAYVVGLFNQMCKYADWITEDALRVREFTSFTGNTLTSYGCGVYVYGELHYMTVSGDILPNPVREKIPFGHNVKLWNPYEGNPRAVTGQAHIVDPSGQSLTEKLIRSWKAPAKSPISLFVTTGTEYSVYIENVRDLDVLSNTFEDVISTMEQYIKPVL